MSNTDAPRPEQVRLRRQSRVLELTYACTDEAGPDKAGADERYELPWEYLRVYSPSAEVRGHHPSEAVLQTGKRDVAVVEIKAVGHYALQLVFDDGHDTGLYTWAYLRELAVEREARWQAYLDDLERAGASRDPDTQVLHFQP